MGKVGPGGRIMARWLDVKNVEGGYGSVKIIHGIDMHVDEGEFVTIIGPNGCGKSTLIKIIKNTTGLSLGTTRGNIESTAAKIQNSYSILSFLVQTIS